MTRASPMSPPERRAAIIDATLPLVREHGLSITTKQIAAAAGVAEGTIFSVFEDKDALLQAAINAAFAPESVAQQLQSIDLDLPLDRRLVAAVEIMQRHLASVWELLSAPGLRHFVGGGRSREKKGPVDVLVLAQLFEPERATLRMPTADAARMLLALTLGTSHPAISGPRPLPARQVVLLFLDGLRCSSCHEEATR